MRWPDFLIIGAYNASTTSLRRELAQHPELFLPAEPEPSFFAFGEGGRWPSLLAPPGSPSSNPRTPDAVTYTRLFRSAAAGQRAGECSPEYLREPGTAARIAARVPAVRLVAVLRDPVERAWSDHLLHVRDGVEHRSFAEVLEAPAGSVQPDGGPPHVVETGFYGRQLHEYVEHFDREQLLVLVLEEWATDRAGMVRRVLAHLGVATDVALRPDVRHNTTGVPRTGYGRSVFRVRRRLRPLVPARLRETTAVQRMDRTLAGSLDRPELDPALAARLRATYAGDVLDLEELLGRKLPWPTATAARG